MTLPPIKIGDHPCSPTMIWSELEIAWITEYAQAAVLAERAACALACDALVSTETDWDTSYWNQAINRCAAAIRARGE